MDHRISSAGIVSRYLLSVHHFTGRCRMSERDLMLSPLEAFVSIVDSTIPSPEPAEVFTSLAEAIVAAGVARVTVELVDSARLVRIVRPDDHLPKCDQQPLARTQELFVGDGAPIVTADCVAVAIQSDQVPADVSPGPGPAFLGAMICEYRDSEPTDVDRLLVSRLTTHAVGLIHRMRTSAALRTKVANLEIALTSNREIGISIGIVAATREITPEQAFEFLRDTSQHANRKLRDIAAEIIRQRSAKGSQTALRLVADLVGPDAGLSDQATA
jgi:hypothetical protein